MDIHALEAEQIIAVSEKLIERHMQLGPRSPLQNIMIADLNARVSRARQRHDEGMKYKRAMENALHERDNHLGSDDKGVRHILSTIIGLLQGTEETGQWL